MAVSENSKAIYKDILDEGLVGEQQIKVLDWLAQNPRSTDKELSVASGMNINAVTGRRNELARLGLVHSIGKRECNVTGRMAMEWAVANPRPSVTKIRGLKLSGSKRDSLVACPVCHGHGRVKPGQQKLV